MRDMTEADLGLGELWFIDYGLPFVSNGVEWHRLVPRAPFEMNYCATHDNLYATVCRSCEP